VSAAARDAEAQARARERERTKPRTFAVLARRRGAIGVHAFYKVTAITATGAMAL